MMVSSGGMFCPSSPQSFLQQFFVVLWVTPSTATLLQVSLLLRPPLIVNYCTSTLILIHTSSKPASCSTTPPGVVLRFPVILLADLSCALSIFIWFVLWGSYCAGSSPPLSLLQASIVLPLWPLWTGTPRTSPCSGSAATSYSISLPCLFNSGFFSTPHPCQGARMRLPSHPRRHLLRSLRQTPPGGHL